jgi:hypothetical protein
MQHVTMMTDGFLCLQALSCIARASKLLMHMLPNVAVLAPAAAQHLQLAAADDRRASHVTEGDVSAAVAAIAVARQEACGHLQQLKAYIDLQKLAVQQAHALGTLRCAHLGCTNLAGASEAQVKGKLCSGCRTVRFCSEACSQAAWRQHKAACKAIQQERQQQG